MPGTADAGTGRGLLVAGVNYRTSPVALRDRFALVETDLPAALDMLKQAGVGEAVLLATCDRVELVTMDAAAAASFVPLVSTITGVAVDAVAAVVYRLDGDAALRHLFAVASALDGHVIGEPQILGQLKAAHRAAAEAGLVGASLESALDGAYAAARRVRRETRIAERPVSLAAAALQLARDIHGDLDRCTVLLLGPGDMGELMAEHFQRARIARLVVCGPEARARPAAERLVCHHLALEDLDETLANADIVIAALGTGRTVLTAPRIVAALRQRPQRPFFIIDAATPADAEPAVNDLDDVFLYDLGDLERTAMAGRATRAAAASEAWRIIDDELEAFERRRAERRAVPAVVALRHHFERIRAEVAAEVGNDVEAATRLLVNRLLHDPSEVLRESAGRVATDTAALETLLCRLFRLGGDEEEGTE